LTAFRPDYNVDVNIGLLAKGNRVTDERSGWDTGSDQLLASVADGLLTVTLNRPGARNALSLDLLDALARSLDRAEQDDGVRVVALTGAGGSFSAGGDVKVLAAGGSIFGPMDDPERRTARQIAAQRATSVRLWDFPKPTVALIAGPAVGAGLALALACDLRYATSSALLRTGFITVGLAGDFGCTWLLTRLLGPARAKAQMYLSPSLTAERARELGLVTEVFPDDAFAEDTAALLRALAERSPHALQAVKSHIGRAEHAGLAECADAEAQWHVRLLDTAEHRTAVAAVALDRSLPADGGRERSEPR
jgi:2-(1,2-epoxy-1,2-dihydrophenyl)acetyl-CoA isomerase